MWAIESACRAWADHDGEETLAAVQVLACLRGYNDVTTKAVSRRLRMFLLQAGIENKQDHDGWANVCKHTPSLALGD